MPSGKTSKKGKQDKLTKPEPALKKGVFIFPNGDKYDGEYVEHSPGQIERCGIGTQYSKDGLIYSGKWENDKINGEGEMKHPSGASYKGVFVDNEFHGQGVYTWPDGSMYSGEFTKNRIRSQKAEFVDTMKRVWVGAFDGESGKDLKLKIVE